MWLSLLCLLTHSIFYFLIINCPFWLLTADSQLKAHVALAIFCYHVLVNACACCFLLLQFYNFGSLLMPHSWSFHPVLLCFLMFFTKIWLIPQELFHLVLAILPVVYMRYLLLSCLVVPCMIRYMPFSFSFVLLWMCFHAQTWVLDFTYYVLLEAVPRLVFFFIYISFIVVLHDYFWCHSSYVVL